MAEKDPITLVNDDDLISFSRAMFSRSKPTKIIYEVSHDINESYRALTPRLNMNGRDIEKMGGDGSCYFCSFSHQMWNTHAFHPFVRFATIGYMRDHMELYLAEFSEMKLGMGFLQYLNYLGTPNHQGHYPGVPEIVMRAACDLFSVRLERLFCYGKQVVSEITPLKHVQSHYHKEIQMSFIAEHVDSMFHVNNLPQQNLGPIPKARMDVIRESGFVSNEDLTGCRRLPCKPLV